MSRKVEILCVGAQKSGTTSLHHILKKHPKLELPYIKEINYFSNDRLYKSLHNFHRHYRFPEGKIAVNVSPSNLFNAKSFKRIYEYNSNMKIIVLLRKPTDRCISQYKMRYRNIMEERPFKHVIEQELSEKHFETKVLESIIYKSMYDRQIPHIFEYFPRNQVHFILFEEFSKDQKAVISDLMSWLDLPQFEYQMVHSNENFKGSKDLLWRLVMKIPHRFIVIIKEITRINVRDVVKRLVRKNLPYPDIDQETIDRLDQFFQHTIEETERLTGLNCDVWRKKTQKK